MNRFLRILPFFYLLVFFSIIPLSKGFSQIIFSKKNTTPFIIDNQVEYLVDNSNNLTIKDIARSNFKPSSKRILNFGLSHSTYWVKFKIKNISNNDNLFIEIRNPTLTSVSFYSFNNKGKITVQHSGESVPISDRIIKQKNPFFFITIIKGETKTYYLKIESKKVLSLPIFLGSLRSLPSKINLSEYIFWAYIGVILIMFFYNLFIFLSTKDKDYLYYIFYIICVGIAQAGMQGYTFQFLWPNNTWLTERSTNFLISMSGISSIFFVKKFLDVKKYSKLINNIFNLSLLIFFACIIINFLGYLITSQSIIQINTFITIIIIIVCGILIQRKGNRSAIFFNISWFFFLISIIIYILKDTEFLPYSILTNNAILIGSSLEIAFLSFALADKINIYKKEKELSQEEALRAAREKEHYIREQNVILEDKVEKRTLELQRTNEDLNGALNKLKSAQSQLVEAEKMSSLGQLTAGIAHEINNPINFVKSNVRPLTLDIQDLMDLMAKYECIGENNLKEKLQEIEDFKEQIEFDYLKEEIKQLLVAIEDGAVRTADIVQGLRTFSRLDEDEIKEASIPEGIDTTLTLLNSIIPRNLTIIKNYGDVPPVECYPGKLNQVFMNILTNAIQAIAAKPPTEEEKLMITTEKQDDKVIIHFADTGPGIPENIKEKIFNPFFTTKEVGEGTGLGLSIVFSIIEKHKGKIEVYSENGQGTEFVIILPIKQFKKENAI